MVSINRVILNVVLISSKISLILVLVQSQQSCPSKIRSKLLRIISMRNLSPKNMKYYPSLILDDYQYTGTVITLTSKLTMFLLYGLNSGKLIHLNLITDPAYSNRERAKTSHKPLITDQENLKIKITTKTL